MYLFSSSAFEPSQRLKNQYYDYFSQKIKVYYDLITATYKAWLGKAFVWRVSWAAKSL